MAVDSLLFLVVLAIVHHPMLVSDKQDPETVQRGQEQEQRLALEMTRLQLEFEQRNQEERPAPRQSLEPNQSQGEEEATAERIAAKDATAEATAERVTVKEATVERVAAEAMAKRVAAEEATVERVAAEEATVERVAAEEATMERMAAEEATAERVAAMEATVERMAAEEATAERVAAKEATVERMAAEKATAKRVAAEEATVQRVAAEGTTVQRVAAEQGPDDVAWDGWHCGVLVIILLFELCRPSTEPESNYESSSEDASSEEEEDATDAAPRGSSTHHPDFPDQAALERFYERHLRGVSADLASTCELVASLVNNLLEACRVLTSQTFLPQLENCIGVASAFEGWCPRRDPQAYRVLVPLLPPKGHSFRLEMEKAEGSPEKPGHVLVELECVCKRERLLGDMLCLLHHAEEDLSDTKQGPFRVHLLCTSSHLDVGKTILWFHSLVGQAWALLAHNYSFQLMAQPSTSSCKLRLAYESGRALSIEIVLGVQRGDSLVFLASHEAETGHRSSTVWLETFAVQEMLFFQLVSRYAPQDSCHLKCLQILIHLKECRLPTLENRVLTTYHFKTALMHLLLLLPLSEWRPEWLAQRLQDILLYLRRSLEEKRLYHFLIGNSALPRQIPVPKAFRNAEPLNLFQPLVLDPAAHAQATSEFLEVMGQVRALLPRRRK